MRGESGRKDMANRIIRYRFKAWFLIGQQGNRKHTLRDGSQHLLVQINSIKQRHDERALKVAAFHSDLDRCETGNQI